MNTNGGKCYQEDHASYHIYDLIQYRQITIL